MRRRNGGLALLALVLAGAGLCGPATAQGQADAEVPADHVIWSQPPVEIDPGLEEPVFCGWDHPSYTIRPPGQSQRWWIVADDFRSLGNMPITSVRWWGSYFNWHGTEPPAMRPEAWRIGFWSNVEVDATASPLGRYPRKLVWQVEVPVDRVDVERAGVDESPEMPSDTCFECQVGLEPAEYFWPGAHLGSTQDEIFWISIAAIYPRGGNPAHPWGWKTRPASWMEGAVTFWIQGSLREGRVNTNPDAIARVTNPLVGHQQQCYDVAFELDTDPNYVKWTRAFRGLRYWPGYEAVQSMAVEQPGEQGGTALEYIQAVADDWKCLGRTPITAIAWWGSYIGYRYRACDGQQSVEPRRPDYFLLSIWSNADDPNDPNTPGHPGEKVWEYRADEYDEALAGYCVSGGQDPDASELEPVFRYSVSLPEDWSFCQEGLEGVYWLSVVAGYETPESVVYPWGWVNHKYTPWKGGEVLRWQMDETVGGMVLDSSGNDNHGTLEGDAALLAHGGRPGGTLSLGGQGYVIVDSPQGLDFAPGSFTVSAWIRTRKLTNIQTIVEYDADGWMLNKFMMRVTWRPEFQFFVGYGSVESGVVPLPDRWYLLTGVYDEKTKRMQLYVNGQPDGEGQLDNGYEAANVAKLTAGVDLYDFVRTMYFEGLIDDVRIFDRALSPHDVKVIYYEYSDDDVVAGQRNLAETGQQAEETWVWKPLTDPNVGQDMSFTFFSEAEGHPWDRECYPSCVDDYDEWVAVGKPQCWCNPRQCHGDADGRPIGDYTGGREYVQTWDLDILLAAWLVKEPPHGAGIQRRQSRGVDLICADFAHDIAGNAKTGYYRVGLSDLNILIANWKKQERTDIDSHVPPNCLECGSRCTFRPMTPTQCPAVQTECPTRETSCPPLQTECPMVGTECYPISTYCPPVETECPKAYTQCPPRETDCQPVETACPAVYTQCGVVHWTECVAYVTECPVTETVCPWYPTACWPEPTSCPPAATLCPGRRTTCPQVVTECPFTHTACYPYPTECPAVETECPAQPTFCPIMATYCAPYETACPATETVCPAVDTQCPARPTVCPLVATQCPIMKTECVDSKTYCPPVQTQCPLIQTECWSVETHCPTTETECPILATQCGALQTYCPVVETQCSPYVTACPATETVCPTVNTKCPTVQTQCPVVETQCPISVTYCPPVATRCPARPTDCRPQTTRCPVVETVCPRETTACPVVATQCPIIETECTNVVTECRPLNTYCPAVETECPWNSCGAFAASGWSVAERVCPAVDADCPTVEMVGLIAKTE